MLLTFCTVFSVSIHRSEVKIYYLQIAIEYVTKFVTSNQINLQDEW